MNLPVLNLLIYAVDRESSQHDSALRWWNDSLSATETIALSWAVLLGFIRLTTNPRVMTRPLSTADAIDYVERWLEHPVTTIVEPTLRHAAVLRDLLMRIGTAANHVSDAHLAALAIEHGADLYSADHDFGRFGGLSWIDPLRS